MAPSCSSRANLARSTAPARSRSLPHQIYVINCRTNLLRKFLKNRNSSSGSPIIFGSNTKTRPDHSLPNSIATETMALNFSTPDRASRNPVSVSRRRVPSRSRRTV